MPIAKLAETLPAQPQSARLPVQNVIVQLKTYCVATRGPTRNVPTRQRTCNAFGHITLVGVESENGRKKVRLDTPAWPVEGGAREGVGRIASERLPLYLGWSATVGLAGHARVVVPGPHGGTVGRAAQGR
jgi:hypothetical protein